MTIILNVISFVFLVLMFVNLVEVSRGLDRIQRRLDDQIKTLKSPE